jgi:hypothetical protein
MEGPGTCQGEDGSFLPLVLESLANADRGTLLEIAGRLRRRKYWLAMLHLMV